MGTNLVVHDMTPGQRERSRVASPRPLTGEQVHDPVVLRAVGRSPQNLHGEAEITPLYRVTHHLESHALLQSDQRVLQGSTLKIAALPAIFECNRTCRT